MAPYFITPPSRLDFLEPIRDMHVLLIDGSGRVRALVASRLIVHPLPFLTAEHAAISRADYREEVCADRVSPFVN